MPNLKNLTNLFVSAAEKVLTPATETTLKTAVRSKKSKSRRNDPALKGFLSNLDTSSLISSSNSSQQSQPSDSKKPSSPLSSSLLSILPELNSDQKTSLVPVVSEDGHNRLSKTIIELLQDDESVSADSEFTNSMKSLLTWFDIPCRPALSHDYFLLQRRELCRERKKRNTFKNTQDIRRMQIVNLMADHVGPDGIRGLLSSLGRETGAKEYIAVINIHIERAMESTDKEFAVDQISYAFEVFKLMKEEGFEQDEEAYSPFLMYFIEKGMVEEFEMFCENIEGNDTTLARLGYYEMHLYISVNNREKIEELCSYIANSDANETFDLRENYLLALCERDRKNELLQLFEVVDITKVSSLDHMMGIFDSLGRLLLESLAKKFLLTLKACDYGIDNISALIFNYATSIPNLVVDDVILKFENWHAMLGITPSSKSYEKLVVYTCDFVKVQAALDIVNQMRKEGLALSINMLNSLLRACEETYEFNLVQEIYSWICSDDIKPNNETFRSMISLRVRMKDFSGAYDMLDDLKKYNLSPTASMYNAILAGYFREKNIQGAIMVLKKMKLADVKPDSHTFSYLISNSVSEDQIIEYEEQLKSAGVLNVKPIYMARINAYANCGQFEKAKQVLLDKGIPEKHINEIKSALISALASHGQLSDALNVYDEIKEAEGYVERKAVISLIEFLPSEVDPSRMLKLLEELGESDYWMDGCCRVIIWCIRRKQISFAVNLLKQLKDRLNDELIIQVIFDEFFSLIADMEPTYLHIGLELLQVMKDELCVSPSRKSLDFLLSACGNAKDLQNTHLIWKEYQAVGYPYNVLNYFRMYQALLASGDKKTAKVMLAKIPKDQCFSSLITASQKTYIKPPSTKDKKKKKQTRKEKEKEPKILDILFDLK